MLSKGKLRFREIKRVHHFFSTARKIESRHIIRHRNKHNQLPMNIHSAYIDKRIKDIERSTRWNTKIVDTTHDEFIQDVASNIFTNLVRNTFTGSYLKKFPCSDCGKPSTERCHGKGEERPLLIRRALERVWSDTSKPIRIKEIIIAFLEEHKTTQFTFKCHTCHVQENHCP